MRTPRGLAGGLFTLLLVLTVLAGAGFVAVYALSERVLRDVTRPPPFVQPAVTDKAMLERGRHLTRTRGCFGCHGQQLQGNYFDEEWPWVDVAVAPNLAKVAKQYDPSVLEAAIRHGIGSDGRALWSMPSYNFKHLRDEDLAALIAFLQAAPVIESVFPSPNLGWRVRWQIVRGTVPHMAELVAQVPPLRLGATDDPRRVRGEYFAMTSCNECHGFDLRGDRLFPPGTPDLAIVASYTISDFSRLLREGIALGERDNLPLMSMIARDRFANLSDDEIADLHLFLSSLANEAIPQNVPWRPSSE